NRVAGPTRPRSARGHRSGPGSWHCKLVSVRVVAALSILSAPGQLGVADREHVVPVCGAVAEQAAAHLTHCLPLRLLREVIDRAGAVDPGQKADAAMADAAALQLRGRPEPDFTLVPPPKGPRQLEIALPLGVPLHGLEQQVAQEEAEVHRRIAEVGRL